MFSTAPVQGFWNPYEIIEISSAKKKIGSMVKVHFDISVHHRLCIVSKESNETSFPVDHNNLSEDDDTTMYILYVIWVSAILSINFEFQVKNVMSLFFLNILI